MAIGFVQKSPQFTEIPPVGGWLRSVIRVAYPRCPGHGGGGVKLQIGRSMSSRRGNFSFRLSRSSLSRLAMEAAFPSGIVGMVSDTHNIKLARTRTICQIGRWLRSGAGITHSRFVSLGRLGKGCRVGCVSRFDRITKRASGFQNHDRRSGEMRCEAWVGSLPIGLVKSRESGRAALGIVSDRLRSWVAIRAALARWEFPRSDFWFSEPSRSEPRLAGVDVSDEHGRGRFVPAR